MNHLQRIACGAFLGLVALPVFAFAAEPQNRGAWFKSLKQPGSNTSCCDISDCKRTTADWREGQWWAVVAGEWTPIPEERELDKESIDGDAYVCSSPSRHIYCFVRPDFGT